jgi:hypothetical protein
MATAARRKRTTHVLWVGSSGASDITSRIPDSDLWLFNALQNADFSMTFQPQQPYLASDLQTLRFMGVEINPVTACAAWSLPPHMRACKYQVLFFSSLESMGSCSSTILQACPNSKLVFDVRHSTHAFEASGQWVA